MSLTGARLPRLQGEKKLVHVLPKFSTSDALHVLTHGGRHLPRRVALVRDYLFTMLAGQCGKHDKLAA